MPAAPSAGRGLDIAAAFRDPRLREEEDAMRFMTRYRPADVARLEAGAPLTDGLLTTAKGARVRQSAGKVIVIDGPFTESKELIGGFAIVDRAGLQALTK
jgi:hypothetical protein